VRTAVAGVRRFDGFAFDLQSRELRKGERRVILQKQPFEILCMMLERPGEMIEREELCRRLWSLDPPVDCEHRLNAAIKRLRRALGDAAARPRFVETIPRLGYRFVADVAEPATDGDRSMADPPCRRLAVLPLSDVGAGSEFTDGLMEELIVQVGRTSTGAVSLIARSSSMLFKDVSRRASEIGQALGVDYLLEGSVRAHGDRARIVAWLVETPGETHVWTETVECRLEGPLSAQVEVATRLARSLDATLRSWAR
jgi:TolB-like protein